MFNVKNLVLGIGIIVVFALALWQGIEAFYPSPQYDDFCVIEPVTLHESQSVCEAAGGTWTPQERIPEEKELILPSGYCDIYSKCQREYEGARDSHAKVVFIISVIVGILAIVIGYSILSIEPVGSALMGSGIWAFFWGSVINWRNFSDIWRFLLLLLALILLIYIAIKLNTGKKRKGLWNKLGIGKK